jgi:succinate dehydrogenase / fumarate reductase, cytochrome b subunit
MYTSTGFLSFLLRRITGVALVLYLGMHMWVIGSALGGPASFDQRLAMVQGPVFTFLEIMLLAAVIYHAIDGIRLLIVHYFKVTEYRKSLFYAALGTTILIFIAGAVPMLIFMLESL